MDSLFPLVQSLIPESTSANSFNTLSALYNSRNGREERGLLVEKEGPACQAESLWTPSSLPPLPLLTPSGVLEPGPGGGRVQSHTQRLPVLGPSQIFYAAL